MFEAHKDHTVWRIANAEPLKVGGEAIPYCCPELLHTVCYGLSSAQDVDDGSG